MNITAVLAIRNEEAYLANCLRHLADNGIDFAIIDNESTDGSAAIYRRKEFANRLRDVVNLPYSGVFSLDAQLARKMELIESLDTDWVIHHDADEMLHSYRPQESLREAIQRLAATGANVVNFDEFVFLPVDHDYVREAQGFPPLRHYYFYEPRPLRLMRAWRKADGFSLVKGAGHTLEGPSVRLAPESLALRHYIVRSQAHALNKYTSRRFSEAELARGWHRRRVSMPPMAFRLPPAGLLKRLARVDDRNLDCSDPWRVHYWQRPSA